MGFWASGRLLGAMIACRIVPSMGAFHGAFDAVTASNGGVMRWQFIEALAGERELTVTVGVGENAKCIGDLKALGAGTIALAAEAAIEGFDAIEVRGQNFLVRGRELLRHGAEIFVELIHIGHAGNRGGDVRLVESPAYAVSNYEQSGLYIDAHHTSTRADEA